MIETYESKFLEKKRQLDRLFKVKQVNHEITVKRKLRDKPPNKSATYTKDHVTVIAR